MVVFLKNGCVSAKRFFFAIEAKCLQNACVYEKYCFLKKVLYLLNHFFLKKCIRIVVLPNVCGSPPA